MLPPPTTHTSLQMKHTLLHLFVVCCLLHRIGPSSEAHVKAVFAQTAAADATFRRMLAVGIVLTSTVRFSPSQLLMHISRADTTLYRFQSRLLTYRYPPFTALCAQYTHKYTAIKEAIQVVQSASMNRHHARQATWYRTTLLHVPSPRTVFKFVH